MLYLEARARGRWPLARVTQVHPSATDGKTRTVTIEYKGNTYKRAVASLLLLQAMKPENAT